MNWPRIFRRFPAALVFLATIALSQSAPAPTEPDSQATASIEGKVTDAKGKPLAGAKLQLAPESWGVWEYNCKAQHCIEIESDEHGNYKWSRLSSRQNVIFVTAPGYARIGREGIELQLGVTTRYDFILSHPSSSAKPSSPLVRLKWKAMNPDDTPIVGASIDLTGNGLQKGPREYPGFDYFKDIELPRPGEYFLRFEAPKFISEQTRFSVGENQSAQITARLCPVADWACNRNDAVTIKLKPLFSDTFSIHGIVTDFKGNPVGGVIVRAKACCGVKAAESGADGRYSILFLTPGAYGVHASHIDYLRHDPVVIEGAAGQIVEQNLILNQ